MLGRLGRWGLTAVIVILLLICVLGVLGYQLVITSRNGQGLAARATQAASAARTAVPVVFATVAPNVYVCYEDGDTRVTASSPEGCQTAIARATETANRRTANGSAAPSAAASAPASARPTGTAVASAPASARPSAAASTSAAPANAGRTTWTRAQKCAWLQENFPQSTDTVKALGAQLARVSVERISPTQYPCDANGTGKFDGFVVLGPNEGHPGLVTLSVPEGGALESYSTDCGAEYIGGTPKKVSGNHPNPCDDTYRLAQGSVKATRITYWAWNDDAPPTSGRAAVSAQTVVSTSPSAAPASAAPSTAPVIECIQPETMADRLGDPVEWADQKFGGYRVKIVEVKTLPSGWSAQTGGQKIEPDSAERTLVVGAYYTIYPPYGACRTQLGFQQ